MIGIQSLVAALAILAAGFSSAAPAHSATGNSTVVSGLVVGGPVPKVASTYPAGGTEVPAGTLVLKIAFDQPMTPDPAGESAQRSTDRH